MSRTCRTCGRVFAARGKARYCSWDCRHGTDAGYNSGCRCDPCRTGHARNHKRLRCRPSPLVPAVGTARRIRGLARLGWSTADLSRRLGRHRSYLLKTLERDRVDVHTAVAVAGLYEQLSMTLCTAPTAGRTAAAARAHGWPPPLAWSPRDLEDPAATPRGLSSRGEPADADPVVIARVLAGEWHLPTTSGERTEVARGWYAKGHSLYELARLTGWKPERYFKAGEAA